MLSLEDETLPWAKLVALDDANYRTQLAYLFEKSAFYRTKLAATGIGSAKAAGGLADIAHLPLTEKTKSAPVARPKIPSARICALPRRRLCASIRPVAPPARRVLSRSPSATSTTG